MLPISYPERFINDNRNRQLFDFKRFCQFVFMMRLDISIAIEKRKPVIFPCFKYFGYYFILRFFVIKFFCFLHYFSFVFLINITLWEYVKIERGNMTNPQKNTLPQGNIILTVDWNRQLGLVYRLVK